MGQVLAMKKRSPDWALERLNRITGLSFSSLPSSLLPSDKASLEEVPDVAPQSESRQRHRQVG